MRNLKLKIAYDGSRYNGFQGQKNTANTIQEVLSKTISEVLDEKIEIIASGRTDAGVHAFGQVINFKCKSELNEEDILNKLNKNLPSSISVKSIEEADFAFHSRFDAKRKTYVYRILNAKTPCPFLKKYTYFYPHTMDLDKMKNASALFIGSHDFRAFSSGKSKKSTVREIDSISFEHHGDEIHIVYEGNGFLYNMVRIITGTLLQINEGTLSESDIKKAFEENTRAFAGFTAPSWGLFLKEVQY